MQSDNKMGATKYFIADSLLLFELTKLWQNSNSELPQGFLLNADCLHRHWFSLSTKGQHILRSALGELRLSANFSHAKRMISGNDVGLLPFKLSRNVFVEFQRGDHFEYSPREMGLPFSAGVEMSVYIQLGKPKTLTQ